MFQSHAVLQLIESVPFEYEQAQVLKICLWNHGSPFEKYNNNTIESPRLKVLNSISRI